MKEGNAEVRGTAASERLSKRRRPGLTFARRKARHREATTPPVVLARTKAALDVFLREASRLTSAAVKGKRTARTRFEAGSAGSGIAGPDAVQFTVALTESSSIPVEVEGLALSDVKKPVRSCESVDWNLAPLGWTKRGKERLSRRMGKTSRTPGSLVVGRPEEGKGETDDEEEGEVEPVALAEGSTVAELLAEESAERLLVAVLEAVEE